MTHEAYPDEIGGDYDEGPQDSAEFRPNDNHEPEPLSFDLLLPGPDERGFAAILDDAMEAQALAEAGNVGQAWIKQRDLLVRYMDADSDAEALEIIRDFSQPEMQAAFAQIMNHLNPKKNLQPSGPRSRSHSTQRRQKRRPRGRR